MTLSFPRFAQDIVWFNVSVDYLLRVQRVQCQQDLLYDVPYLIFCEALLSLHYSIKVTSADKLGHYIKVPITFQHLDYFYDIGVVDALQSTVFVVLEICIGFGPPIQLTLNDHLTNSEKPCGNMARQVNL